MARQSSSHLKGTKTHEQQQHLHQCTERFVIHKSRLERVEEEGLLEHDHDIFAEIAPQRADGTDLQ